MKPGVTILILNWNGKKYLQDFLPSVLSTQYDNFNILVVDNGSTDDSVEFVKQTYPEVRLLELDKNYGFTTGNNKALPHIDTPYLVLLNSDVEVDPNWLGPMVELMESDKKIAAVQPKLLAYHQKDHFEYAGGAGGYIDALGYPFCRGRLFEDAEKDEGQYDDIQEVFWATGACCMIRKSVVDQIGMLEDRFFAHMEEIDFCWRARNFGYKIMSCPESVVYHVGGGTLNKVNPRKTFLNVRNSLAALVMNFPAGQVPWKLFARLLLDGVWAAKALTGFEFKTIGAILKAHFAFYFSFFYWMKRRKEKYKNLDKFAKNESGYYKGSIVWQHFVRGKKRFQDLKF